MSFYPNIPIIHISVSVWLFSWLYFIHLTVVPVLFLLYATVFFKIFFFTFIYSCVLSSVFYTINEWMNASNKYLFIVLMLIFSAWCICAVCLTGPSSSLSPSVSFFRFSSVILCFAAKWPCSVFVLPRPVFSVTLHSWQTASWLPATRSKYHAVCKIANAKCNC